MNSSTVINFPQGCEHEYVAGSGYHFCRKCGSYVYVQHPYPVAPLPMPINPMPWQYPVIC